MTLSAGAQLGPYEILGPVGAGGMGEVVFAFRSKRCRIRPLPSSRTGPPAGHDSSPGAAPEKMYRIQIQGGPDAGPAQHHDG